MRSQSRGRTSLTEKIARAKALRWKELVMVKTEKVKRQVGSLWVTVRSLGFIPRAVGEH